MDRDEQKELHDRVRGVEELAYDIAAGAIQKKWTSLLAVEKAEEQGEFIDKGLNHALKEKWGEDLNYYSVHLLAAFGFLERKPFDNFDRGISEVYYQITQKAFDLLSQPSEPPEVFISYRRAESSAFALYVEARLRLVGVPNPFVDKNLKGGDDWHAMVQERIEQARYFVSLIGPTTLGSNIVRKEIGWAQATECVIIPVCHNGHTLTACAKVIPDLTISNGYEIGKVPDKESAQDYETAANFVLNGMGYRTN